MGRGECVITHKDLALLGKLTERKEGYRLSELASLFDLDPQSVQPNLKRLTKYGLVDSYAEKAERGVGAYYRLTPNGGELYRILQVPKEERRRLQKPIQAKEKSRTPLIFSLSDTPQTEERLERELEVLTSVVPVEKIEQIIRKIKTLKGISSKEMEK